MAQPKTTLADICNCRCVTQSVQLYNVNAPLKNTLEASFLYSLYLVIPPFALWLRATWLSLGYECLWLSLEVLLLWVHPTGTSYLSSLETLFQYHLSVPQTPKNLPISQYIATWLSLGYECLWLNLKVLLLWVHPTGTSYLSSLETLFQYHLSVPQTPKKTSLLVSEDSLTM